jgi:SAM-dependent methyltransferase
VSLQLASLGYDVTAVDVDEYPFRHPNLHFHRMDFLTNHFADNCFDAALAISAVEHAGLGFYGDDPSRDGDYAVVKQIYRVLRTGAQFIVTVPYGKQEFCSWYRVYDSSRLRKLLHDFVVKKIQVFDGRGRENWTLSTEGEIGAVDSISSGAQAVACVAAEKP